MVHLHKKSLPRPRRGGGDVEIQEGLKTLAQIIEVVEEELITRQHTVARKSK